MAESSTSGSADSTVAPAPGTKVCPDCAETVLAAARVCRFCRFGFSVLQGAAESTASHPDATDADGPPTSAPSVDAHAAAPRQRTLRFVLVMGSLVAVGILGVVLLLAPVPPRLKEWAYAGFAIDLASAVIAHLAVGDGPEAWGWAAGSAVLWALSYLFWRRLQAMPAVAPGGSRGA